MENRIEITKTKLNTETYPYDTAASHKEILWLHSLQFLTPSRPPNPTRSTWSLNRNPDSELKIGSVPPLPSPPTPPPAELSEPLLPLLHGEADTALLHVFSRETGSV